MHENSDISKTSKIKTYLFFFSKSLRLSNPWNYKVPVLISFTYLVLLLANYTQLNVFFAFISSLFIIIGVAGIGYTSNDLGDRKQDKSINRQNILTQLSPFKIVGLFVLFFALAIFPWFYLPFNLFSLIFFSSELLLFFLYALPPFRFKELGFLGVLTDSLYAHVLPALLASYTFFLFTKQSILSSQVLLMCLLTWQFFLGLRNILFHQLSDLNDDLVSATRTFVTKMGEKRAKKLTVILILLELSCFLFFLSVLFTKNQIIYLPIMAVFFWLWAVFKYKGKLLNSDFRTLTYLFLDDLYVKWMPLAILIQLCTISNVYVLLLILHIVLFKNDIKGLVIEYIKKNLQN